MTKINKTVKLTETNTTQEMEDSSAKLMADLLRHDELSPLISQIVSTWSDMNSEFQEMGLNKDEIQEEKFKLFGSFNSNLDAILKSTRTRKLELKQRCFLLQKNIFKILKVFTKGGYVPKVCSSVNSSVIISDETYAEIEDNLENDQEYKEIIDSISKDQRNHLVVRKIQPPYSELLSDLQESSKKIFEKFYSRLLTHLDAIMLLKELAQDLDYYTDVDPKSPSLTIFNSLPSSEQCENCIDEIRQVLSDDSMIETVVMQILDSNIFNNLSRNQLRKIQKEIELMESEKILRTETIIEVSRDIVQLYKVLYGQNETGDLDNEIVSCAKGEVTIGLTLSNLNRLREQKQKLDEEKIQRVKEMERYSIEFSDIIQRLQDIPEGFEFKEELEFDDLSIENFNHVKRTMQRLHDVQREHIKDIIHLLKYDIESYWQKFFFAESETRKLTNYWLINENTPETLSILENELKRLKDFNEKHKNIFEKIDMYNALKKDRETLIEASKDPSRLLAKNSGMALLKESKMRRNIERKFPRVCLDLEKLLKEFAELPIDKNEDFSTLLSEVQEEAEAVKRKMSPVRKKSVSPKKVESDRSRSPVRNVSPVRQDRNVSPVRQPRSLSPVKQQRNVSPVRGARNHSPTRGRSPLRNVKIVGNTSPSKDKVLVAENTVASKQATQLRELRELRQKTSPKTSPRSPRSPRSKIAVPRHSPKFARNNLAKLAAKSKIPTKLNASMKTVVSLGSESGLITKLAALKNPLREIPNLQFENAKSDPDTTLVGSEIEEKLTPIIYESSKRTFNESVTLDDANDSMANDSMYVKWKMRRLNELGS